MSRNITLIIIGLIVSIDTFSGDDSNLLPYKLEVRYPNNARVVAIFFSHNEQKVKIEYNTYEKENKRVEKLLDREIAVELTKGWKENVFPLLKNNNTEIGCDLYVMWVVEIKKDERKVFCQNKRLI